jgi:hypothetical protein
MSQDEIQPQTDGFGHLNFDFENEGSRYYCGYQGIQSYRELIIDRDRWVVIFQKVEISRWFSQSEVFVPRT